jgi:hypothetical protein
MFNHVLSIAAFGFVAFVLLFMHPVSQASRAVAHQVAAGGTMTPAIVAPAIVTAADMRPHLAASK